MSWVLENSLSNLQRFIVNILKCGPIPKHLGIIMDGNRRYAKKINVEKTVGHSKGFDKLSETLEWCREIGITEVTVYAFSIENFKRTPKEVDELMELSKEKFQKLLDEQDKFMSEGICIRVIGDLTLLSEDLQKLIAKAMLLTKDNKTSILNIAFAYTSRDEITNSIKDIVNGVENKYLSIDDVTETLVSQCLYTSSSPDLFIRTSGEVRLSDFLLWQVSQSIIYFADVLWPEFSFWDFVKSILNYQRSVFQMKMKFKKQNEYICSKEVEQFLGIVRENKLCTLQSYAEVEC